MDNKPISDQFCITINIQQNGKFTNNFENHIKINPLYYTIIEEIENYIKIQEDYRKEHSLILYIEIIWNEHRLKKLLEDLNNSPLISISDKKFPHSEKKPQPTDRNPQSPQ